MKILDDVEPDAMLHLEKNSGAGEEPTDYMSESWDVWHNNCTAAIEDALRTKPQFLAVVGGLPIQTIMCTLEAFELLFDEHDCQVTHMFSDMRIYT